MREATIGMNRTQIRKTSKRIVRLQTDPFFNECRAYSKFLDRGVNGKVAVRCHGHLAIPAAIEDELAQQFEVYSWNRPLGESRVLMSKRQPLHAIVKDLVQDNSTLNQSLLRRMWMDLRKIRKLGVHP